MRGLLEYLERHWLLILGELALITSEGIEALGELEVIEPHLIIPPMADWTL